MKYLDQFKKVKNAARTLSQMTGANISETLNELADTAIAKTEVILSENQKDLDRMDTSDPKYDRLLLTKERILQIASDLRSIANTPSPVGELIETKTLENGLLIEKKRVSLGVIGIIYEARPNVTFDVFALCIRSGNAVILKGGSDAEYSNKAIVKIIKEVLTKHKISEEIIQLLPVDREAANELMNAVGYIDLLIPRGSQNLINSVRENSKVPVIETGAGIVHTYIDETADIEKSRDIIFNAKVRRVSVCNALDCIIIHQHILEELPFIISHLAEVSVHLYADSKAMEFLKGNYPDSMLHEATEETFGTEFLDYKLAIKTVSDIDEALDHIYQYSSKHSEAIISEDPLTIQRFLNEVDAAAVYANASTAFTDGSQFGMGAEIGISTQKLHARGPMALRELTSYKWIIKGNGQVRPM